VYHIKHGIDRIGSFMTPSAFFALVVAGLLAGCASQPTVTIEVPEYVAVPPALLASYPCGVGMITTNGELLAAYAECVESSAKHEADKAAIGSLGN